MLQRENEFRSGEAVRKTKMALLPNLRVYVVETRNLTMESRSISKLFPVLQGKHQVAIPLKGELVYRREGKELLLKPGSASLDQKVLFDERWSGSHFQLLMVEFDAGLSSGPLFESSMLSVQTLGAIDHLVHEGFHDPLKTATLLEPVLQRLQAAGIDVPCMSSAEMMVHTDPGRQLISDALGTALSSLSNQPMWVDLVRQVGLSERQLRRRLNDLLTQLGVKGSMKSFRSYLRYHRLFTGAIFMTASNTSVEEVSEAIGYGSPRAYCLANRQQGLPTPGSIRDATLQP